MEGRERERFMMEEEDSEGDEGNLEMRGGCRRKEIINQFFFRSLRIFREKLWTVIQGMKKRNEFSECVIRGGGRKDESWLEVLCRKC
jgi:hypothetical protein